MLRKFGVATNFERQCCRAMQGLSENENHFKIGSYLILLWAKNRRKSTQKWAFWHKNHIFRGLKIAGGNKNGWVGGIS